MSDERRRHIRVDTPGMQSNLSDGRSAFVVMVDDVSKSGVGMSDVPAGFDATVHKCLAVVNAPLEDFELNLEPRWVHLTEEGQSKRIGFQIMNPAPAWVEFVEGLKGKEGDLNRAERHSTIGMMALISDGRKEYFAVVESVSATGLRLTHIPAEFDDGEGTCTAVVNSSEGDVSVSLRPCWIKSTNKGMYKTVGFQIHNPPKGWQELLKDLRSEDGRLSFLVVGEDEESEE